MLLTACAVFFVLGFGVAVLISSQPKYSAIVPQGLAAWLHIDQSQSQHKQIHDKRLQPDIDDKILLTKAQCEDFPPDTWQRQAYANIKSTLLAEDDAAEKFPCIYAAAGYRQNQHRYVFLQSDNPSEPRNIRLIANALRAFRPLSHSLGPNTSLLLVHPPSEERHTVETYRQRFWDILRGLRSCDSEDWPADIPTDVNAAKWMFCFDGAPWFFAAMTPAHEARQSRRASNFTVAIQPRWVFDHLFRTPEMRRQAVDAVRKLIPAYDTVGISPDLASYGDEGSTEAHQYYLLDENKTSSCPYNDLDAS